MAVNLKTPERIAQVLAVLCLMILILMAGKPSFTNASEPVRGIHDPGIALQMARNADEVDSILGPAPSADREVMRLKQYLDFAFIVTYVGIAMAMVMALKRMRPLAFALLFAVTAAGIFDWTENLAILPFIRLLHVLDCDPTPLTAPMSGVASMASRKVRAPSSASALMLSDLIRCSMSFAGVIFAPCRS